MQLTLHGMKAAVAHFPTAPLEHSATYESAPLGASITQYLLHAMVANSIFEEQRRMWLERSAKLISGLRRTSPSLSILEV